MRYKRDVNFTILLCSASAKVYQVLHDVLQRTEPTHKAGLGNNYVISSFFMVDDSQLVLFICQLNITIFYYL